ncbi:2-hydroxyacid dehydrogenase [Rhizobium lentis]|uniref:2-hydroxyacid dehydrogenase n=1 Tax=Rhizobium lentis TaxID=1138194 RepID=A0A9Q3MAA8_9HYPH|nr:2-hydroxyacid dehydrogenase [Rhizobium lentis]MBX5011654.1 2-hydroxyacid dehydrogenase [Rhizobium lentis]MBX5024728.1 2-hydroxyacid dehydrogenase [Rhizobium lentis]MBX5042322.1 2-hydroxyacid dehydrogenase [Rhizobium lentis]MBX5054296.1 2-hydroxyacid dehydrogenase [Rhizobium lentis]MBX5071118.1 2-hydroxyacid dehydrogenase [Rhizobium lentis]
MSRIAILVPGKIHERVLERLKDPFEIIAVPREERLALDGETAGRIRGVAVSGAFAGAWMDQLPGVEVIASFGVGYDGMDVKRAAEKGIVVTNTPDVLNDEVADTAVGLLLNTIRELPRAEAWLREGNWKPGTSYPLSRFSLKGRHVGLYGLGRIGLEIAKRLEPFKVKISYHTRSRHADVSYDYYPSLKGLAEAVDTLIAIVPKTPQTHKTIDADILAALGANGILVNVGRGWTVDEEALSAALASGSLGAAGLDVFYEEPSVPSDLLATENAVLLPHVASASVPTRNAMADLVADNLIAWFEKGAALTPVPETPQKAKRD